MRPAAPKPGSTIINRPRSRPKPSEIRVAKHHQGLDHTFPRRGPQLARGHPGDVFAPDGGTPVRPPRAAAVEVASRQNIPIGPRRPARERAPAYVFLARRNPASLSASAELQRRRPTRASTPGSGILRGPATAPPRAGDHRDGTFSGAGTVLDRSCTHPVASIGPSGWLAASPGQLGHPPSTTLTRDNGVEP